MTNIRKMTVLALGLILTFTACSDDDKEHNYDIPTTYSFENVDYSGQTLRMDMLAEMKAYLLSANEGVTLDAGRLAAMYANESSIANWAGSYDASKQLRNKTSSGEQAAFDAVLAAAAEDSQGGAGIAAEGVAGVLSSLDGSKSYFVNGRGVEYLQIIEKGLMSACFMHQIAEVYLGAGKMDVDNNTVTPGKGTEMEHHWDEAFGYFGVPIDFPSNTSGLRYWGNYCNRRDALLQTNSAIMDAYLKGRAAISHNDLETRDEQIEIIRAELDKVAASTTLNYINTALTNFNDPAIKFHALSEAVAFYYGTQFIPNTRTSANEANEVLGFLGGSTEFLDMNFWNTTISDLETARTTIANAYGWDANLAEQF